MLNLFLDLGPLLSLGERLSGPALAEISRQATAQMAAATHAHIIEEANAKLHSRLKPYLDNLKIHQESEDTWYIELDKSVRWIEEGVEPHEMINDLLTPKPGSKGKVRTAKDGSRFRVIPFGHGPGKGPATTTSAQQSLITTIKQEMKSRKIPFGKIEQGADGKPLTGLLHKFDIMSAPKKTHEGPGQGWGRVGQVKQGPTGIPFLQGVRVYQHLTKDEQGAEKVRRSVTTFRIVSSKMAGTGRWFHPGLPPADLFKEAVEWAQRDWEQHVLPQIAARIVSRT